MASFRCKTNAVKLLIKHKANVDITTKCGDTPLILAAYANRMSTVRALVEAGADTTIRDGMSETAAHWAKVYRYDAVAEYLATEAPRIRFHQLAQDESGQLSRAKGRSSRAIWRDLKENSGFVNHTLQRLEHFCIGKHR